MGCGGIQQHEILKAAIEEDFRTVVFFVVNQDEVIPCVVKWLDSHLILTHGDLQRVIDEVCPKEIRCARQEYG